MFSPPHNFHKIISTFLPTEGFILFLYLKKNTQEQETQKTPTKHKNENQNKQAKNW